MTDDAPGEPQVQELMAQIEKLTDIAARAQADLQNFKARMQKDAQELGKFAIAPLLLTLLPVLDDLKRAEHHAENIDGLTQVTSKLEKVLTNAGLQKIESIGQKIDPLRHEVLTTAEGEKDVILEVHEEGYELHGKILRPAKVVVGSG